MRVVSVSTALFDGYPMEQAIEEIGLAGARSVEPAYIKGYVSFDESAFSQAGARRLRTILEAAGLPSLAVSAHLDLGAPDALDMLERRIRFAAGIGARFVITNAGAASMQDAIVGVLERVIPVCEASGIVVALENPGHGAGDILGDGRMGAALLARLSSSSVRMNYDAGNIVTYSHGRVPPHADFPAARDWVSHLHLKDILCLPDEWRFTAVGEGAVDYAALWPLLPPDLPVALELPLRLQRPGRGDPVRMSERRDLETIRSALATSLRHVARWDSRRRNGKPQ